MNLKLIIKIVPIFVIWASLFSQEGDLNPPLNYNLDVFPKSPDAAALGKFIDIPHGDYTGTATFSIPIYTIELDGINFPIELNYSTSGVKVSEISSRVGLGWALNVGNLSLTKQVIGTPDKETGLRPKILSANFNPSGNTAIDITPDMRIAWEVLGIQEFSLEIPVDIKPDIYSYNLPINSGKFILDSSGEFGIPIPYSQIKIEPSGIFPTITDENGNKFIFKRGFGISSYNTCNHNIDHNLHYPDPNYRISEVKTYKNNSIHFHYNKSVNANYVTSMVEQKRLYFKKTGQGNVLPDHLPLKCFNYTDSNEEILTQINFPGGIVEFKYNDDLDSQSIREDLPGDYYLKKVIVKDLNRRIIKEITLNYGTYFESPNSGGYSGEMFQGINKRLKLIGVKDEITGGVYNLEYYENFNLPHRLSNSQDYWGVYNGQQNTTTSIPTTVYRSKDINDEPYRLFLGANKEPNFIYGVNGNLKRIYYPTGGHTNITYEPDDYIQSMYTPPPIYEYDEKAYLANSNATYTQNFTINDRPLEMSINFTGENDNGSNTYNFGNCEMKIFKVGNSTPIFERNTYSEYVLYDSFETGNYNIQITPGFNQNTYEIAHCSAELTWTEQKLLDSSSYRKMGTIRVAKIENVDAETGKIVREFTYLNPNSNYTQTSGKNLGDEYFYALSTKEYPYNRNGTIINELILSNNPGWQINTVRGKAIGYDYVQEKYIGKDDSFYKEYKFSNDTDDAWTNHNPLNPINISWPVEGIKRGLILYEKLFDSANNLKYKKEFFYDFDPYFNKNSTFQPDGTHIVGHGLELNLRQMDCSNFNCYYEYSYELFPIKNYWIKEVLLKTTEFNNQNISLVTEQQMEYSPTYKHTFLSKKIMNGSTGEEFKSEYYYPQDLTSNFTNSMVMNKMIERNQVSTPIITKTFNNSVQLSETETSFVHYYEGNSNEGFILPQYVYSKKGSNVTAQDKKITYDNYDEFGNLTEYTLENGIPVSIIWGYNNKYPIAKIEGKRNSEISTLLINNIVDASNSDVDDATEENLITYMENLRKDSSLENAIITTYTYDPLIGVTTIIAPNGQVSYYKYDDAGRLDRILDNNNKVLKKIEYNYQH